MEKWYEVDEIWPVFGIKDRAEYVQRYVLEGRFHTKVPEDIVKSYQTAEHLMALAWYHYPMYDEALKKLLAIVEIAIKLKCQQLGIPLEYHTKSQKRTYILKELIDKICAHEPEKDLNWQLHHARKLRNIFAHPEQHSFMGGIAHKAIIPLLNAINLLFLPKETVITAKAALANLKQQFSMFQEGVFVLEQEGKKYLLTKAEPMQSHQLNGTWSTCWTFQPVLTNLFEALSNHRYAPPIVLTLSNPQLNQGTLTATELHTNSPISLYPTTKPQNHQTLNQHQQEWEQLSETDQKMYLHNQEREAHMQLNKYQYTYYWS